MVLVSFTFACATGAPSVESTLPKTVPASSAVWRPAAGATEIALAKIKAARTERLNRQRLDWLCLDLAIAISLKTGENSHITRTQFRQCHRRSDALADLGRPTIKNHGVASQGTRIDWFRHELLEPALALPRT